MSLIGPVASGGGVVFAGAGVVGDGVVAGGVVAGCVEALAPPHAPIASASALATVTDATLRDRD